MTISTTPTAPVVGELVRLASSTESSGTTRWKLTSQPSQTHVLQGSSPAVATLADLRRVAATARADRQTRLVEETDEIFRWSSKGGAGVADDDDGIIRPLDVILEDPGRWYRDSSGFLQDAAGAFVETFTPVLPGEYGFTAYHYRLTFTAKGRATGDEVFVATDSGTVHVGTSVELPIVTLAGDGATLVCRVLNATVQEAALEGPTSERARIATLDTAVVAALAALAGVAVASIGPDIIARAEELRQQYEDHRAVTGLGVHASADSTNVAQREVPASVAAAIVTVADISERLEGHQRAGSAGGTWHSADDTTYLPITKKPAAGELSRAIVHLEDIAERVYERHRVLVSGVHGAADNTNALAAPTKLSDVIVTYLDALAAQDPTAAAGEVEGAADAAARYGFTIRT